MKALMVQENRNPPWDSLQIAFVDPEALQLPPDVFMHRQRGKHHFNSKTFQDSPSGENTQIQKPRCKIPAWHLCNSGVRFCNGPAELLLTTKAPKKNSSTCLKQYGLEVSGNQWHFGKCSASRSVTVTNFTNSLSQKWYKYKAFACEGHTLMKSL